MTDRITQSRHLISTTESRLVETDAGNFVQPSPEDWAEADKALADLARKVTPEWFESHRAASRKQFATLAMISRQNRALAEGERRKEAA